MGSELLMKHTLELDMDYSLGVDELLTRLRKGKDKRTRKQGRLGWVAEDINSANFPLPRSELQTKRVKASLVHLNESIAPAIARQELRAPTARTVNICEILQIVTNWPSLAFEFPLVAADSVWTDKDDVSWTPYVHGSVEDGVIVNLAEAHEEMKANCRFPTVVPEKYTGPTWVIA